MPIMFGMNSGRPALPRPAANGTDGLIHNPAARDRLARRKRRQPDGINRTVNQTSLDREEVGSETRRVENTAGPPDGSGRIGGAQVRPPRRRGRRQSGFKDRPEIRRGGRGRGQSHGRRCGWPARAVWALARSGRTRVPLRMVGRLLRLRKFIACGRGGRMVRAPHGHRRVTAAARFGGREERSNQERSECSGEESHQGPPRRGNHFILPDWSMSGTRSCRVIDEIDGSLCRGRLQEKTDGFYGHIRAPDRILSGQLLFGRLSIRL